MEPEILMIGGAAVAAGALLGLILGRLAGGRAAAGLVVLLVAGAAFLLIRGQSAQGWDGMAYAAAALIFAAPAALGAALGGWAGARLRARRRGPRNGT